MTTTETPDYAKILRQGALEDVLCNLIEDTFRATNAHLTYLDGDAYGLVVDKTSGGTIRATLYRDDYTEAVEVAQVRLDYTVKQVQP